jgi:protein-disulfide isomerase
MEDGQAAGVTGTPAFFINGRLVVGAQPYSVFKNIIEEELSKK